MPAALPRPFLKWVGGKQALASTLRAHFPTTFGRYYEPFLGGGSMFFAVAPARAVLGDDNAWLLDTYAAVRDDWRAVAQRLDALDDTREAYLQHRATDPATLAPADRAALFIYLNKTGFRGLFRVNRHGRFNVPYGAYGRRTYDPDALQRAAEALRGAELRSGDFARTLADAGPGDFVYLDPPYHKLGGYADFTRYTPGQFREADQRRLAALCATLATRGVRWALSNSNTPLVRELYAGFRVVELQARREINLHASRRTVHELLILAP